ncbi:hypothetical protein AVEN_111011-1 [Araneus ventricosus]|uniref:Uncharacterized protein n=1 Tax=Araneus ventricosus TaxID=182803 RepID=A0A4Y2V102_ARAVE|nr:hypothetical protein AVEN_111011-1 [Araneus ventricosus]
MLGYTGRINRIHKLQKIKGMQHCKNFPQNVSVIVNVIHLQHGKCKLSQSLQTRIETDHQIIRRHCSWKKGKLKKQQDERLKNNQDLTDIPTKRILQAIKDLKSTWRILTFWKQLDSAKGKRNRIKSLSS